MERAIAHRVSHLCYWLTKWVRVNNCSINSKSSAQNWKAKAWKSDAWLQHSIFKWTNQKHLNWCIDITSWHPLILVFLGFHFKPKTSDASNSKHWTLQLQHTPPIMLCQSQYLIILQIFPTQYFLPKTYVSPKCLSFGPSKGAFTHCSFCLATHQTSDGPWHRSVPFWALELKVSTVAEERRGASSLSLPLKSRCSVAGTLCLHSPLCNRWKHTPTHPLHLFLSQTEPPFQHSQSNNAIRTLLEYAQEALPPCLLYRSPFSTQKVHYYVKVHFSLLNAMRIMRPTLTLTQLCTILSRSCHPTHSKYKLITLLQFWSLSDILRKKE